MVSEELELRMQVAEARAEEKTYEQFDEQQVIDGMNDYLKNVPAKVTFIPILSEAQPNGESTVKVPSVKFQRSAIVSIISTTTSVTTPISVSAATQLPNRLIQETFALIEIEEDNGTPPDTKLYHDDKIGSMYVYRKDSSAVESTKPDQDYFDIQRKQAELSKIIFNRIGRKSVTYSQAAHVLWRCDVIPIIHSSLRSSHRILGR